MHRSVSFTVYGNARPAGSKTAGQTKTGKLYVRDAAKGSQDWKRSVSSAAGYVMNDSALLEGPLRLSATFYLPRPKGHFGKRGIRPSAPKYPTTKPDCLKLGRAVEDGMIGVVYRDDAQIVQERLHKVYGEPARCEILVSTIGTIGEE